MWSKGTPATTVVAHSYPINIFVCGPLQPSPITSTDIIQNTHTDRATGEYYQLKVRKDEKKMSKRLERGEEMGRGRFNRPNKRSLNRLSSTSSRPHLDLRCLLSFLLKSFLRCSSSFLIRSFSSFPQLFSAFPMSNKMYEKL